MLDLEEQSLNSGYSFGTSPPNRPFVAEGSDLFRAVMEDFKQDFKQDSTTNKLTRAIVDKKGGNSQTTKSSDNTVKLNDKYMCKRCLSDRTLCRCFKREKGAIHRVQWVDEIYDKPLAIEQCVTDITIEGRTSPVNQNIDGIKPILKHKATCIIVVSE